MPQNITINSLVPFLENNLTVNPNATFIGIDFGTSTTVVSMAYWEGKTIKVEPLRLNQKLKEGGIETSDLVPTVIAYLGGNNLLIGKGAADLKFELKKGKNVWYSFKMELGEDIGDKYFESIVLPKNWTTVISKNQLT
ncbi:hypothetical protein [Runella aurantiaca]|uniref:Uncharacterized protein n=1 Tax=Runella aurantiaca TaxID=2282308 RepID=A0A369IDA0_9BACT|nr:hypothetical protein [Runella aurantiaca]RDB05473.1 hypothetical protein DVG78_12875 [Runella aurantiaca]